jgi:uncharacterized cofD-like protein
MRASYEPKLVVLGGGTGSFTLLQGLKELTSYITAIVNMSDNGGSTGVLRDELGVLPPGDIRQCLVALSDNPEVRNLFSYRFADGRFEGQSLGNIILSGLELQHGSFEEAVRIAGEVLHIRGRVLPVTLKKHTLYMNDGDKVVRGQAAVSKHYIANKDPELWQNPTPAATPEVIRAIHTADIVVIAPGNLYASLLPLLMVEGIVGVLQETKATIVQVTNLVNKPEHTKDWHVVDYVRAIERVVGKGVIDHVLYNTQGISDELLQRYAADGEFPVRTDPELFAELSPIHIVGAPLVSDVFARQDAADKEVRRTLIRHDAKQVAAELKNLLNPTKRPKEA